MAIYEFPDRFTQGLLKHDFSILLWVQKLCSRQEEFLENTII